MPPHSTPHSDHPYTDNLAPWPLHAPVSDTDAALAYDPDDAEIPDADLLAPLDLSDVGDVGDLHDLPADERDDDPDGPDIPCTRCTEEMRRAWAQAWAIALVARGFGDGESIPPPHLVDEFATHRPWRDQPTPGLIALADTYRADLVQAYRGLHPYASAVHHFVLSEMIAALDYELTLRERGGVNLAHARREGTVAGLPPAFVQRVRAAHDLLHVICTDTGQRPPARIGRCFMMRSPFREETHPSFAVYPDGHYYDFATQETGDTVTYIMRRYDHSFADAVRFLAAAKEIPLPADDRPAAAQPAIPQRRRIPAPPLP